MRMRVVRDKNSKRACASEVPVEGSSLRRCSIFSRTPSESGRLCYVRMRTTVRMRTGEFVNFAVWNFSPPRALLERMRALNF
ncbi:hypothetical protein NDU88_007125 [Pleurodeles waltl]|uniref:Uncharacterized protein n=1 Tax=Pleurodeles waltl TaxID=8319 RepID=A0AAV7WGM4_PLEWA|nr:hypothetical protein NDU88_007125 [Pleurodeles waltl]